MASAVFGGLGLSLFVAGATVRAILGDSQRAKCCIFPYKMRLQDATSKEMTILYVQIMLGSCSNRLYIVGSNSESFR